MPIRTLLVDDEENGRRGLRVRLEKANDIQIIGECENGTEAVTAIDELTPDLVFLDIQMPEMSGFEVLKTIKPPVTPHIIFVTAFDQYAVRAFEVHALDYLLKPIDGERFAAALRHARSAMAGTRDGSYGRQIAEALTALTRAAPPAQRPGSDRLAIPDGDRVMVLRVADIDWIQASDNYVSINVGKKAWLLRETISSMEQRLSAHGFARIHRSTIVNTQRVAELRSLSNGDFSVILSDGMTLRLSKTYRSALDQVAGNRP
jgi:two-component system, LytTR family, response regulator